MTGLINAYELLLSLGFVEDPKVISDEPGGLSFDFGSFKVTASHTLNHRYHPIVNLFGIMAYARTVPSVDCNMPREFESREQGIAWVTWCLDHGAHGVFVPKRPVPWLTEGRAHRHLLPWERAMAAYLARPQCSVQRDFARLALRRVADLIGDSADDISVTFSFDGQALSIRVGNQLTIVHASGDRWQNDYWLPASQLRRLPRRLMHNPVYFSIWGDRLEIDSWAVAGVEATDARAGA